MVPADPKVSVAASANPPRKVPPEAALQIPQCVTAVAAGMGAETWEPGLTPVVFEVLQVVAGRPVPAISLAPVVPGSAVWKEIRLPAAATPSTPAFSPASVNGISSPSQEPRFGWMEEGGGRRATGEPPPSGSGLLGVVLAETRDQVLTRTGGGEAPALCLVLEIAVGPGVLVVVVVGERLLGI